MSEPGVPNFIKHYRKLRKLTLEALAETLDPPTTKGTISQIETAKRGFSLQRLFDLARALETTPGALLDGPVRLPTESELALMLAAAQAEVGIEALTIGGYPSAVASGLRARLLLYSGARPSGGDAASEPLSAPGEGAQPPPPTTRSSQG